MDQAAADIAGAAEYLAGRAEVTGKVGCAGFCAGRQPGALVGHPLPSGSWPPPASTRGCRGSGCPPSGPTTRARRRSSTAPRRTARPPPRACRRSAGPSRTAGGACQTYDYPGTAHAFFNEDRPEDFDQRAAATAWARTAGTVPGQAWLSRRTRPPGGGSPAPRGRPTWPTSTRAIARLLRLPAAGRPGGRRSRATSRAAFRDQEYWGRPVPGFGAGRRADRGSSGWPRPRTAATGPAGSSPGTAPATCCSPRCTAPGWPTSRPASPPTTGWRCAHTRIFAAVRCAPPDNKPTPAERDTCAPWLHRELALIRPTLRVVVALGAFAWAAWWPALPPVYGVPAARAAAGVRPRGTRGLRRRSRPARAATTSASRTPSPAGSPRRCWTTCSPGRSSSPGWH